MTSIHCAYPLCPGVHKFRQEKGEAIGDINPGKAKEEEDVIDLVFDFRIVCAYEVDVLETVEEGVRCNKIDYHFEDHRLPHAGGDQRVKLGELVYRFGPVEPKTIPRKQGHLQKYCARHVEKLGNLLGQLVFLDVIHVILIF